MKNDINDLLDSRLSRDIRNAAPRPFVHKNLAKLINTRKMLGFNTAEQHRNRVSDVMTAEGK